MSTKKTTKKVTTGAKTVKTSAPMETRVKTEPKLDAVVASKVMKSDAKAVVAEMPTKLSAKADVAARTEATSAKPSSKTAVVAPAEVAPAKPSFKAEVVAIVESAPTKTDVSSPAKLISKHEVDALVREAAFLFAKRRNFRNGTPTQDWLAAETFVHERLTARGFTVSA